MQLLEKFLSKRSIWIRALVFTHDVIVAGLAYLVAEAFRSDTFTFPIDGHWTNVGLLMASAAAMNWLVGLNHGVWRYASLPELIAIIRYSAITVLMFSFFGFLLTRLSTTHRTTIILTFVFMVIMTGILRVSYRILRSRRAAARSKTADQTNALVIGTGDNVELFIKAAKEHAEVGYRIRGIIDDRRRRIGLSIHGVNVLSDIDGLDDTITQLNKKLDAPVAALILARTRDRLGSPNFDRIMEIAANHGLLLLRLPDMSGLTSIDNGKTVRPHPIRLEDLLSRPPCKIESLSLSNLVNNASVLVTGAGGSIGSELCRQILSFKPRRLILVDNSEFLLFTVHEELKPRSGNTILSARLGDVRNTGSIAKLIEQTHPDLVLHAAALKHVPMVEQQPLEGLLTNVIGTKNLADACVANGVKSMVLISTDKAVNPSNVMGASKRLAEMYCQSLDISESTRFVTVRFGNVLGSAGSVVPIFEKQIAEGGPVTVTHPDIERFFMTIPEAVSLVLHATDHALDHESARGSIFVLDMGRPVRIADMARRLIQLSGLRPELDIKIVYTGLRPGEKLYEELFTDTETLLETSLPAVRQAAPHTPGFAIVSSIIDELKGLIDNNDAQAALRVLLNAECRYTPSPEALDQLKIEKRRMH